MSLVLSLPEHAQGDVFVKRAGIAAVVVVLLISAVRYRVGHVVPGGASVVFGDERQVVVGGHFVVRGEVVVVRDGLHAGGLGYLRLVGGLWEEGDSLGHLKQ